MKLRFKSLFGTLDKNAPKIFCIGRNKTGTTSLKKAFRDLGYVVGHQPTAEKLADAYFRGNYKPIIQYCKTAQVFQDVPFSFPETYKCLDQSYPGSKYILSVRSNAEEWYNSLTQYHSKLFGGGQLPTAKQLENVTYVRKGWVLQSILGLYKTTEADPYNKDVLLAHYNNHNNDIVEYFKSRDKDLLVINLKDQDSYKKFCEFLQLKSPFESFPWKNKTSHIEITR